MTTVTGTFAKDTAINMASDSTTNTVNMMDNSAKNRQEMIDKITNVKNMCDKNNDKRAAEINETLAKIKRMFIDSYCRVLYEPDEKATYMKLFTDVLDRLTINRQSMEAIYNEAVERFSKCNCSIMPDYFLFKTYHDKLCELYETDNAMCQKMNAEQIAYNAEIHKRIPDMGTVIRMYAEALNQKNEDDRRYFESVNRYIEEAKRKNAEYDRLIEESRITNTKIRDKIQEDWKLINKLKERYGIHYEHTNEGTPDMEAIKRSIEQGGIENAKMMTSVQEDWIWINKLKERRKKHHKRAHKRAHGKSK